MNDTLSVLELCTDKGWGFLLYLLYFYLDESKGKQILRSVLLKQKSIKIFNKRGFFSPGSSLLDFLLACQSPPITEPPAFPLTLPLPPLGWSSCLFSLSVSPPASPFLILSSLPSLPFFSPFVSPSPSLLPLASVSGEADWPTPFLLPPSLPLSSSPFPLSLPPRPTWLAAALMVVSRVGPRGLVEVEDTFGRPGPAWTAVWAAYTTVFIPLSSSLYSSKALHFFLWVSKMRGTEGLRSRGRCQRNLKLSLRFYCELILIVTNKEVVF